MARTKTVVLRLSEEEYNLLKELSGREPMNAYLRRVAGLEVQVTTLSPFDVKVDASNVEAVERVAEMLEPSPPDFGFRCPVAGCQTRTRSSVVTCNVHGRKVVPV